MSVRDIVEKVKERQGLLSKIQNVLTGGYGTKEDLRELDKKMRDYYYIDFKALRHRWEEIYLSALDSRPIMGDHFKKIIQVLDRIAEKVNRGDYGYAGLMDRKGHIRETELANILNYDKDLNKNIDNIANAVSELYGDSQEGNWDNVEPKVKNIKSLILDFESKWNEREKVFRPLEI